MGSDLEVYAHSDQQRQQIIPMVSAFEEASILSRTLALADAGKIDLTVEEHDSLAKMMASFRSKTASEKQSDEVIGALFKQCDFCHIESLQNSPQMTVWFKQKNTPAPFKPFREGPASALIAHMLRKSNHGVSANKVKNIYDTLKMSEMPHLEVVPSNIIRVSPKYYWDTETATLVDDESFAHMNFDELPLPSQRCFRELFDSSGQVDISVNIDDIRLEPWEISIIRRYLADNDGLFASPTPTPQDLAPQESDFDSETDFLALRDYAAATLPNKVSRALAPFWTWANEDLDTMNDLIKVFATPFLRTPPKWFVYYIGDTRNGKSSCIKCQRVLLGLNNTSGFAMPALFDPHNSYHVLTTMLNAADEDYDFAPKDLQQGLANFKKAATHDEIDLPNFYSQTSTALTPKFLSIFSRNSLPDFGEGDGAQAVNKRMRAIFFRNDLSKFDNNGHDFEKETYTANYYSALLPVILAMAQHYNNAVLDMSLTCRSNSNAVESVTDPAGYFFNELCYWFDNTYKNEFVIDQAKLFFKENGIKYSGETLTAINNKLAQCEKSRIRPYPGAESKRPCCTVLPNRLKRQRLKVLAPDAYLVPFDNKQYEMWRRAQNEKLRTMDAQDAFNYEVHSVFYQLRELEDSMLNPAAMQEHLDAELSRKADSE